MKTTTLSLALLFVAACGSQPGTESKDTDPPDVPSGSTCNASNCGGCCNGDRCETGITMSACGSSGAACIVCSTSQTCTSSGRCEAASPADAGTQFKRVFITRNSYDGNLKAVAGGVDGLDSADKLCARAADSVNLGGVWKAWLSASAVNAVDRISDVGPWRNMKGELVFNNKTNFLTGPINPIEYDERGGETSFYYNGKRESASVWTGSTKAGTVASWKNFSGLQEPATCVDWTSNPPNQAGGEYHVGGVGFANSTTTTWTEGGPYSSQMNQPCYSTARLICFEQ